jgi:diacylglycerol kinase (ATP)
MACYVIHRARWVLESATAPGADVSERFSLRERIRSFPFAFRGIALMLRLEHNARIHLVASIAVVALGLLLGISLAEWCWLVLAITIVWSCEAINTAIESLADAAVPERNPLIERAKDAAAGAVLIAAIGAATVGLLVLGPPLLRLLLDLLTGSA